MGYEILGMKEEIWGDIVIYMNEIINTGLVCICATSQVLEQLLILLEVIGMLFLFCSSTQYPLPLFFLILAYACARPKS